MADKIQIITYLNILELPTDKPITEDIVQSSYRKLSKIYHPDVANERYSDGKKFIQLQDAREYLIKHISEVNSLIRNGFSSPNSASYSTSNEAYERWKQEQEFQRRMREEEEQRRRAEEAERRRQEEECRRQEELKRQKADEEKRKREEQELKKKISELKERKINDTKKLLEGINKDNYYESDYKTICSLVMEYISFLNNSSNLTFISIGGGYQSLLKEINRVKTIQKHEKNRKIKIGIVSSISSLAVIILFLVILTNVIIPNAKYKKARRYLENGKFQEASELYVELNDYKESKSLSIVSNYLSELFSLTNYNIRKIMAECQNRNINVEFSYDLDGGTHDVESYYDGVYAKAKKEGYNFTYNVVELSKYDVDNSTLTIKLTAKYSPINYKLTYVLCGGEAINPSTYTIEDTIKLNNPTRKGYTFTGWTLGAMDTLELNVEFSGKTEDRTFTAHWVPSSYEIKLNSDGGTQLEPISISYNETCKLPNPQKSGYTFEGWYLGNIKYSTITYTFDYDIELMAKWSLNNYTIICKYQNGESDSQIIYTVESDNITLESPSKKGYSFLGWSSTIDGNILTSNVIETGSIGDKTFYANWTNKKYIINYNLNNGVNNPNNPSYYYADEPTSILMPTREGYSFLGWSEDDSIDIIENPEIVKGTYKDIIFIAHWEPLTYTISYELLGGTNNDNNPKIYTHDANDIALYNPYMEGYDFDYWLLGDSQLINNTIKCEMIGDITLTAKWIPKEFNISLDVNTGNPLNNNEIIVVFDEVPVLPMPSKIGYDFIGWYFNNIKIENELWKIAENVTLTAKWTPRNDIVYRINYHLQNIDDDNYSFSHYENRIGTADSLIDVFVLDIDGFTTPASQITKILADGSQIVDFYFDRNYYDISFITNGGTAVAQKHLKYEATFTCEETIREGYTFGGWFTDVDLINENTCYIVQNNNIALYAWWEEESKPCNLTYELVEDKYSISGYTTNVESEILIPVYINNIEVIKLTNNQFANSFMITKLIMQDNIVEIGPSSLKGYDSLKEIKLSSSIVQLYNNMFGENNTLENITLPYAGTSIDNPCIVKNLLRDCSNIKKIIVLNGSIAQGGFQELQTVEEIVLPSTLSELPMRAFYHCENLKIIELPDEVTVISEETFARCNSLETFDLNNVCIIGDRSFELCISLKKIESNILYSVGVNAFSDCYSLEIFNCPQVSIDKTSIFYNCSHMIYININSMDFNGYSWIGYRPSEYYVEQEEGSIGKCKALFFLFGNDSNTEEEDWKYQSVRAGTHGGRFYFAGWIPKSLIAVEFSHIPSGNTSQPFDYSELTEVYIVSHSTSRGVTVNISIFLFKGTKEEYSTLVDNDPPFTVYYYSDIEPEDNKEEFWHYNEYGVPELYVN